MEKRTTKRRKSIKIVKTLVAVERERERERGLYRLNFLSRGTEFELFSIDCEKKQNRCVCHLVNNKDGKYSEYIVNKGRTMLFYNGIGLSLRVFEQINLAKIKIKKVFGIINNIPKNQLSYNGARDGP